MLKGEGIYPILFDTMRVPMQARTHSAYVARPDAAGEWPTVMIIGGIFGLAPPVRDLCRRLARHGFAALAPDLYAGRRVADDAAEASARFRGLDETGVRRILTDVGRYLADGMGPWDTDEEGFGVVAIQAGALPGLGVAIDFEAPLALMAPDLREPSPGLGDDYKPLPPRPGVIHGLSELVTPLLGLIGRDDEVSPMTDVAAAREAAPHSQWVIYDGLGHDFLDDNASGFDQAAFADAFERITGFLAKNL